MICGLDPSLFPVLATLEIPTRHRPENLAILQQFAVENTHWKRSKSTLLVACMKRKRGLFPYVKYVTLCSPWKSVPGSLSVWCTKKAAPSFFLRSRSFSSCVTLTERLKHAKPLAACWAKIKEPLLEHKQRSTKSEIRRIQTCIQ